MVYFENSLGELFERKFVLDFSQYSFLRVAGVPVLYRIANDLERLRVAVENWNKT